MTSQRIGDDMLNAYVDGELSSAQAAEVARAAAQSPTLAARIASLREMKAAVADLVPPASLALPEPARRPARAWRLAAAAAVVVALAMGAALSGLVRFDAGPDWPSTLESHHRSWAFSRGEAAHAAPASAAMDALEALDLSAARLTFVGRERIAYREMTFDRVGYEGTRGCRLSLFRLPRALQVSPQAFGAPLHVRVWREDGQDFLLMAEGMAAPRFQELATAIERALREHKPFDADTRQRLAKARAASRPCQA